MSGSTEPLPWDTTSEEVLEDIGDYKKDVEDHYNDQLTPEEAFAKLIVTVSEEFDDQCEERHKRGGEKYGPGKFLTVDTLQEAIDEIVDLANYARYTYIKLRLLQHSIAAQLPEEGISTDFIGAKKFTSPKED